MGLLGGAIRLGRVFGIHVHVHILFLLWIGYSVFTAGAEWAEELAILGILFGTVLCHEFGHCIGARLVGGEAQDILLWPLGGLAYADAPMRPWPQFVTVACGPLVNVVFFGVGSLVLLMAFFFLPNVPPEADIVEQLPGWLYHVLVFTVINLVLLGFNLLPVFPLDGGQLFRVLLWRFIGLHRATRLAAQVGVVGALVLGGIGLLSEEIWLVFIAIFGGTTSWRHYQAARRGMETEQLLRADHVVREKRGRRWGLRSRTSKSRHAARAGPPGVPEVPPGQADSQSPGPGGDIAELNRLRRKVEDGGVQSLSYVDRQKLERILRAQQQDERSGADAPGAPDG